MISEVVQLEESNGIQASVLQRNHGCHHSTILTAIVAKPRRMYEGLSSHVGMVYDANGNLYIANWSVGTVL